MAEQSDHTDKIEMKGITWDHIRGYGPMLEAGKSFHQYRQQSQKARVPLVSLQWDRRSLKDFGDQPLRDICAAYDILLIDHPHLGLSSEQNLLLPLDEWLADEVLTALEMNSVGPSYHSYAYNGHLWALPVDAAAQVSAYRPDVLNREEIPQTWSEVLDLARKFPRQAVGWPLCPTDAICSLTTLCVHFGGIRAFSAAEGYALETLEEVLAFMQEMCAYVHPMSLQANPIQMLDILSEHDGLAYVPLLFGYVNYSQRSFAKHVVCFRDMPVMNRGMPLGSILGGVGIAVSAACAFPREATAFAAYVAGEHFQNHGYFQAGGQPAHRTAWTNPQLNAACHDFFNNTLSTLEHAFLRPRVPGYPLFQEKAGMMINSFLHHHGSPRRTALQLKHLYEEIRHATL